MFLFGTKRKRGGQERNDKWWQIGAAASILGVNPVFPGRTPKAQISRAGKRRGLKVSWTGIRPILEDREIETLAGIKCLVSRPYQPIPSPSNWFWRQWNKLRSFQVGAGSVNVGIQLEGQAEPKEEEILWNKKLFNGWFKNFDSANRDSGFIRIWDYRPSTLSAQQLEDLHNVALSIVKR